MKRLLLALAFALTAVGLTGCDGRDETDDLYRTLVGRIWAGDLGFYQKGGFPLDSFVYFGADGFGYDELHYVDNGQYCDRLNIRWELDRNRLRIDYGQIDHPRELRYVRIHRRRLSGDLYINNRYYDTVTLYMQ